MNRTRTRMGWTCAAILGLAASAVADQVYLREPDAARAAFPEGTGHERKNLNLSDAERGALDKALGKKTEARSYPYLEVRKDNGVVGLVFLLDVVGQSKPISFAVGVTPAGSLRDFEVMVYREPHGDEIREARFRRQFVGKRLEDPITLGKDVDAISGATISSRSATYAARKGLGLAAILRHRGTGTQ